MPVVLAVLLCDQIIMDAGSGKKSLIGIFDQITVGRFPAAHHRMAVYARLTDGRGRYTFRIDIVPMETEELVAQIPIGPLDWQDPMTPLDVVGEIVGLRLPTAGRYEVRIFANEAYLAHTSFAVVQAAAQP